MLTVVLGFCAGGYFAGATGGATALAASAVAARLVIARRPLAAFGPASLIVAAALAAFGGWILASATWSDSLSRSLVELDRLALYLAVFLLMATVPRTPGRVRALIAWIALALTAICAAGLLSRTLPDVFPTTRNILNQRLAYPLTYWNALALAAGIGLILCAHLAADRGRAVVRAPAAAAMPVLAAVLVLTYSRAGIAVAAGGLLVYLAVGRPVGMVGALVACVPATALAVHAALGAELLSRPVTTTPAAITQGHRLALVVGLAALGAGLLRTVLGGVDRVVERTLRPHPVWRRTFAGGAVAAVLVAGLAAGAPSTVRANVDGFFRDDPVIQKPGEPLRDRLALAGGNHRVLLYRASLRSFRSAPLRGTGAGTFPEVWNAHRPHPYSLRPLIVVLDGHSLYLETLGELGAPGLALLVIALGTILVRLATLARGEHRAVYGALLAAVLAWALHAGVDWDWEMPAVTAWVFAAGGLVCARGSDRVADRSRAGWWRALAAVGCLALAALGTQVAAAQQHLRLAVSRLDAGDCAGSIDQAERARHALGALPQPYEVRGICLARLGRGTAAVASLAAAVRRDPHDWDLHYELAVVRASAGRDPRPELRVARRLNPSEPILIDAQRRFDGDRPARWRREAAASLSAGLTTSRSSAGRAGGGSTPAIPTPARAAP